MVIILIFLVILSGVIIVLILILDSKKLHPILIYILYTSICLLYVSMVMSTLHIFDFSNNQLQFALVYHGITYFNICLVAHDLYKSLAIMTPIILPASAAILFLRQL